MPKTNEQLIEELMTLSEGLGIGSRNSDLVVQTIARIRSLEGRIADLEESNSEMGWRLNPDRMGGAFSEDEIARSRGDTWR